MEEDFSFSPFSVSSMKVSSIGCCYFSVIFQDQGLTLASGFYIFPKIFIF